jgi:hypothetical protein
LQAHFGDSVVRFDPVNCSILRALYIALVVLLLLSPGNSLSAQISRFEFIDEPNDGEQKITDDNDDPGGTILGQFKYTIVTTPADFVFMNQLDTQPAAQQATVVIADPDEGIDSPEVPLFEGITFLYPFAKEPAASTEPWVLGPITIDGETPLAFLVDQGPPRAPSIGGFQVEGGRSLNLQDPNILSHFVDFNPSNPDVLLEIIFNRRDVDTTTSLEVSFIGTITNNTSVFDTDPDNDPNPNPVPGATDRREALADVVAQLGRILSGVPDTGPPLSVELVGDVTTQTGPFPLNVALIDRDPPNASDPPGIAPAQSGPGLGLFNPVGFDFRTILADGDYEIIVGARDAFNNVSPGGFSAFGNLNDPVEGVPTRILVRKDTIAPQDVLLEKPRSVFIFGNTPPSVDPPFEDSIFILKGTVPDERGDFVRVHILSQDSPDVDSAVGSANNQPQDALFVTEANNGLLETIVVATPWAPRLTSPAGQVAYRWGFAPEDLSGNMNTDNDVELLMIKDFFPPNSPVFTNLNPGDPIKTSLFTIRAEAPNGTDANAEHGRMSYDLSISLVTPTSGVIPIQSVQIPASTSDLVPITNSILDDAFLPFSHEIAILDPAGVATGQIETVSFSDRTDALNNLVYQTFFLEQTINFQTIPDGILRLDLCLLDQVGNRSNPCTSIDVIKDTTGPSIEFELGDSGPDDNYTTSFPTLPNFFGADNREFIVSLKSPEFTVDDGPGGSFPVASVPDPHFQISGIAAPPGIALLIKGRSIENFGHTTRIDISGSRIPSFSLFDNVSQPSGTDVPIEFQGTQVTLNEPPFGISDDAPFEARVPMLDFREGVQEVIRLQSVDNLGNKGTVANLRILRDIRPADAPEITVPPVLPGSTLPLVYTNQEVMAIAGTAEPSTRLVVFLPPENSPAGFDIDSTKRIQLTSPGSIPIPGSDFDSIADSCANLVCLFVDADELGNFRLNEVDISTIASSLSTPTTIFVQAIDTFDNTDPVESASAIEVHRNTLQVPVDRLFLLGYPDPNAANKVEIFPDSLAQSPGSTVFFSSLAVRFALEALFPMLEAPDLEFRQAGNVFRQAGKLNSSFPIEIGTFSFRYAYEVLPKILDFDGPVEFRISGGRDLFGNPVVPTTGPLAFLVDTVAPNQFSSPPVIILSPADSLLLTTYVSSRIDLVDRFKDSNSTDQASGVATGVLDVQLFGPLQRSPDSLNEIELTTFLPPEVGFDLGSSLNAPLVTDGTYRLSFLAVDLAGNQTRFHRTFVLDRLAIAKPLLISNPQEGSTISTFPIDPNLGVFVRLSILDIEADLQVSDFQILGPTGQVLSTSRSIESSSQSILRSFQTSSIPNSDGTSDGFYTLEIEVFDKTGNRTAKTIRFLYDTRPPVSKIEFPSSGSCVKDLEIVQLLVDEDISFSADVSGIDISRSEGSLEFLEPGHPENENSPGLQVGSTVLYQSQDGDSARTHVFAKIIHESGTGLPRGGSFDGLYQTRIKIFDQASNQGTVLTTFQLDTVAPTVSLSGLGDLDFATNQNFAIRGTISDRGPCGLASASTGFFATSQVSLELLAWDQDAQKAGVSLAGPFHPRSIPSSISPSFPIESSQGSFLITGVFPGGVGFSAFEFRLRDLVGNENVVRRVLRLHDSLPSLPRRVTPLTLTQFRGQSVQTFTTSPVQNLRWEAVEEAVTYRLHLSRESNSPGVRTTFLDFPSFITSQSVDYTFVNTSAEVVPIPETDSLYWFVESLDGIGQGSDPTGAFGRGEEIRFDRVASPVSASQVKLLTGGQELDLDSAQAFATGTSVSFLWLAPEPVRITGKESAWIEYLRDGSLQFLQGVENLPVETTRLVLTFPFPQREVNGQANLHLEFFKDRAQNRFASIIAPFKIDRGPEFRIKIFQNPVDPLSFGFVFKALDFDGRLDALKLDSARPTPRVFFSQASQEERELPFETLRTIPVNGENFGTAFSGNFEVDMDLLGDVWLRLEGEDFRGFRSQSSVFLHVRSDRPLRSKLKVSESARSVTTATRKYLVGHRENVADFNPIPTTRYRKVYDVPGFPYLYFPQRRWLSSSGTVRTSANCSRLVFVESGEDGELGRPVQKLSCVGGALQYSVSSHRLNRVDLVEDTGIPELLILEPEDGRRAGDVRFLVQSIDRETAVSSVHLISKGERMEMFSEGAGLFSLSRRLSMGEHEISIETSDLAGNPNQVTYSLNLVGSFSLESCGLYPNPVRNDTQIDCRFTQEPEDLSIGLYDTYGSRIRTYSFFPAKRLHESLVLESETGVPLRNGVYFLKLHASKGKAVIRRILKMALIR